MASTSSNSSRVSKISLRNSRFYLKKRKAIKKNRGPKKTILNEIQKVFDNQSHQLNGQGKLNYQERIDARDNREELDGRDDFDNREEFDGRDEIINREEFHERDEFDNREEFDGRDEFDNQEEFDRRDEFDGQEQLDGSKQINNAEQDNSDGNRHVAGAADNNENLKVAYRRKEKKRRAKERKRYEDLKKDMAAMNDKIDPLVGQFRGLKAIINRLDIGAQPVTDDEIEDFDELPRLPLKKFKYVLLMEENATNDRTYKKQLIAKLRTVGGHDIKKNVINIFKVLFSTKLKTEICWKGSLQKRKAAFENFESILDIIRQAVKFRHKNCTADDIARECKLRFKQAEKDYDRELLKQS